MTPYVDNLDVPSEPPDRPRRGEWGGDMRRQECIACEGLGYIDDPENDEQNLCNNCHGTGFVEYEDLQDEPEREG
jgi:hypothetical protein